MMADHYRTKKIMSKNASESEEGEIEDDTSPHNGSNFNLSDSENSEDSANEEVLDIKPPPATLKSSTSRKDSRKSKHRKHSSHRREHYHDQDRNFNADQNASWAREKDRKRKKEEVQFRVETRERDKKDVRDVKLNRDIREFRGEKGDSKIKSERHVDSFDIKKKEWREKRLNFIEKKREQSRIQSEYSRSTKESVSDEKDLRHKLRDKERLQKERRLERFRSPPKNVKHVPSSIVVKRREKELHITPEPIIDEEPMECDKESDLKNGKTDTGKDSVSKSENDSNTDATSDDTDSKSEDSSNSSGEESKDDEESEDEEESQDEESKDDENTEADSSDSSSSDTEEEEEEKEAEEKSKPAHTAVQSKPEPDSKTIFATYHPAIQGCRSVDEFNSLTRIEEGTYGVVYRAIEKATGEIVALKRLKMEKEKEGFPITSLREINTLLKAQHQNIVSVREIVVGSNIDRIYIVMDYVEHDLKSLMKTMKKPFTISEVISIMGQLLRAVAHLHDNWILHRDLKPSNLLLSHKGTLKVGDFGLAREYGSPLKSYTPVVVTLWYRAPELLLGVKKYSTAIDMWSVGCIFGELLMLKPLFPGESEMDQLKRVFKELGTPSEKIWPGFNELPLVKKLAFANYPYNRLKHSLPPTLTNAGFDLINRLLTYSPAKRITAEDALSHDFISKNLEEKEETNSIASFNLVGADSDQSVKGGGFSLRF